MKDWWDILLFYVIICTICFAAGLGTGFLVGQDKIKEQAYKHGVMVETPKGYCWPDEVKRFEGGAE